jgi:hypothetical protein
VVQLVESSECIPVSVRRLSPVSANAGAAPHDKQIFRAKKGQRANAVDLLSDALNVVREKS